MNTGGWLLLSVIFSVLLLLVQRSERQRRNISFVIVAIVGWVVWRYAIYRISGDCNFPFKIMCQAAWIQQAAAAIAYNTADIALLTALVFNGLFWVLIGRSNPPGSSDSIQVLGMND